MEEVGDGPAPKSAVATQLSFNVNPTSTVSGLSIAPSIIVSFLDIEGNLTASTGGVTLSFGADPSSGTAIISGTLTVVAVAGQATFSNISIDKVFTGYTLAADSGGLGTEISTSFDIIPRPTVTITTANAINASNEITYNVIGTCSENGRTVTISIGGIAATPTCTAGSWDTGSIDVSSLSDGPSIIITADHDDASSNQAIQATTTVVKDTLVPTVTIGSAPDIDQANETSYEVSGTCSENGRVVTIDIGGTTYTPNCAAGVWTIGVTDVSGLADGTIVITADHDNLGAVPAIQASTTVTKDATAPTVTISSAPNINTSNETSYSISGTCSENGRIVTIGIGGVAATPTCGSGTWSTGATDVSSLPDGSVAITADHDNSGGTPATQAAVTVTKDTVGPTVTSLSVASTLTTTADINWALVDPGGYTINDYIINYRVKGTSTWLLFSDGVSLAASSVVTSLVANTIYEFRVAVLYDTVTQSSWSNTAEGTTKPDDPLFSSPYVAMNVGGATSSTVVAFEDTTAITLNGVALVSLDKGQTHTFSSAQFDYIDADKPIYTAGRVGLTSSPGYQANVTWNPTSWGAKNFSFNATRNNPQQLKVFATENATIEVRQGGTLLSSTTLTSGTGGTLSWSLYGSYQVTSTGTIMAYHMSGDGSNRVDPKPLLPSSLEIIGFPSSSMRLTTDLDGTNYSGLHSNSVTFSNSLSKIDSIVINPQGTSSLYQSDSTLISADKKISGASFADSNGYAASPFLPTNLMKTRYAVNVSCDYVAFASKQAGTIEVRDASDTLIETLTLVKTGAEAGAPYKARRGTTAAGMRFISTVPVAGWYQPNTNTGGSDEDETILYGSD